MAVSPDLENLLESFLYSNNTILDMEEVFIPKTSWVVLKQLDEIKIKTILNVAVVGLRSKSGKFIPMPKKDLLITAESYLLLIGKLNDLKHAKKFLQKLKHLPIRF